MSIAGSKWLGPDPRKSLGTAYRRVPRLVAHEWLSGNALEGASWKSVADSRPAFTKRLGTALTETGPGRGKSASAKLITYREWPLASRLCAAQPNEGSNSAYRLSAPDVLVRRYGDEMDRMFQGLCDFRPDARERIASACREYLRVAGPRDRAGSSRDGQDFVAHEMKTNAGGRTPIEVERIHSFDDVPAELIP